MMTSGVIKLYDEVVNKNLLIRRINIGATRIRKTKKEEEFVQLSLFDDLKEVEEINLDKEKKVQESILKIKKKYGKNAIMKGMNLEEGATMKDRNNQIGGHKA